jgi:hypothetical protein
MKSTPMPNLRLQPSEAVDILSADREEGSMLQASRHCRIDATCVAGSAKPSPRMASILALIAVVSVPAAAAQTVDRSAPPVVQEAAPGFSVRRLPGPITIDGQNWIAVNPVVGIQTVFARSGEFALSFADPVDDGDVERFQLTLVDNGGRRVLLSQDAVSYVYVTPDSRWIFIEPLEVIDVRTWRRYRLSRLFGIDPYVLPEAISSDGRRVIIRRQMCAFDCQGSPVEYYEVGLPGN